MRKTKYPLKARYTGLLIWLQRVNWLGEVGLRRLVWCERVADCKSATGTSFLFLFLCMHFQSVWNALKYGLSTCMCRVCAGTEDGKIVTDTELVVWWFCLLMLVGLLFYAVNFWFYIPWFYLLFISPTEICVWTMIFFLGFTFFTCFLVRYVSRIPNEVRKSYDTNLKLMLIIHAENK